MIAFLVKLLENIAPSILKKIGEGLIRRYSKKITSDILVTPEIFWDRKTESVIVDIGGSSRDLYYFNDLKKYELYNARQRDFPPEDPVIDFVIRNQMAENLIIKRFHVMLKNIHSMTIPGGRGGDFPYDGAKILEPAVTVKLDCQKIWQIIGDTQVLLKTFEVDGYELKKYNDYITIVPEKRFYTLADKQSVHIQVILKKYVDFMPTHTEMSLGILTNLGDFETAPATLEMHPLFEP